MATTKKTSLRKKSSKTAAQDAPPEPRLIDALSGLANRVLAEDAIFFIENHTGNITLIAKDRVSNAFRRRKRPDGGYDIAFYDRGADIAPEDPADYATIEDVEDLVEEVDTQDREAAQTAQHPEE